MLPASRIIVLGAVIVAALMGALFYAPFLGHPSGSSVTTSTVSTSCTSSNLTTTGASTSVQATATVINGSFTTFPNSQIRVDSVQAKVVSNADGTKSLSFWVMFTNIGSGTVYVMKGCGSSMNSTITSGSAFVRTDYGGTRCLCAEYLSPLSPGESFTATDPGCWSSYRYFVMGSGGFSASISLSWSDSAQQSGSTGHLKVSATFSLP